MDNFWTHLEAMAGVFDAPLEGPDSAIERLQRELRQMSQSQHDAMAKNLNIVAQGISNIATLGSQDFIMETTQR
jgi:hypothetical protein